MPNYQCNVCEQIFSGGDALFDIKEHLMDCAVNTIIEKHEENLITNLKEAFPNIESIEVRTSDDFDEPDYLFITRKDGHTYELSYRNGNRHDRHAQSMYEIAKINIEAVESLIDDVIRFVQDKVPHSDIHFSGMRSNTGYMGNGFHFSFTINGETITLTYFKNSESVASFTEKVVSYYQNELTGILKKSNDQYTLNGVSVNQWLLHRVGKELTLKEK